MAAERLLPSLLERLPHYQGCFFDPQPHFERIRVGNYFMSIQGSDSAYSSPRAFLTAESYQEMEVAFFTRGGEWAYPKAVRKLLHEYMSYPRIFQKRGDKVGYVPLTERKEQARRERERAEEAKKEGKEFYLCYGMRKRNLVFSYVPVDVIEAVIKQLRK